MKKSLRFITLILAAVFLISGTMMVVCYAAPDEGGEAIVDAGDQGVDTPPADAGNQSAEAPAVDGQDGNSGQSGEEGQAPVDNQQTPADNSGQTPAENEQTPVDNSSQSANENHSSSDDGQSNYDSSYEGENDYSANNYVEDDEPLFYGDASNYDYNIPESEEGAANSVSSQTTLYNTSGMSEKDAAPNEWSDIVLDEKSVKTGVADFSAIKSNTETKDDGDWILYLGYVLIGLSALGILYFIVATITQRKAAQKAERMERRRSTSPARSEAARMEERERRASGTAKRTSRFADEATGYSRRASSKADTGEVYIPRRAAKKSR